MIPHGIPNLPFEEPALFRKLSSTKGTTVLLTCGLLSPNKGLENVIRALPQILSRNSDVVYIIAGATHPHVRLIEGDRYLLQLKALARELGVEEHVIFQNRFLSPQEMASLVCSAVFTSHLTVTRRRQYRERLPMPWAPERRLSRRHTGTLPNFWTMGAARWFPLRIRPRSAVRQPNY